MEGRTNLKLDNFPWFRSQKIPTFSKPTPVQSNIMPRQKVQHLSMAGRLVAFTLTGNWLSTSSVITCCRITVVTERWQCCEIVYVYTYTCRTTNHRLLLVKVATALSTSAQREIFLLIDQGGWLQQLILVGSVQSMPCNIVAVFTPHRLAAILARSHSRPLWSCEAWKHWWLPMAG